jgi:amino acid adenylation domain-containing protein
VNRDNIEDLYRLTPIQQGMLFHALEAGDSAVYVEQFCYVSEHPADIDFELWTRAWQEAVDQHPVMRTSFLWEDLDEPIQIVHKWVTPDCRIEDLRELGSAEQERRIVELQAAELRRGFDLRRPPLSRFVTLRLSDTRAQQVWTYHHLILDGLSANALMVELGERIQAWHAGVEPRRVERRPFKDYVAHLRRQDLGEVERYWRERLGTFTRPTPLGVDRPPGGSAAGYGFAFHWLPEEAASTLSALARSRRLTLNSLVVGAWAALLGRLSGQDDVVFGQTVLGRPPTLRGFESMLGCFINTLPVRVALEPGVALGTWLERIQADQMELRRFEGSPLVEVLGWSGVPRGQKLFESILVFENAGTKSSDDSGQMVEGSVHQRTNYPLTIVAIPGTRLGLRVGFERSRFEDEAIQRLLGHLETLLTGLPAALADGRRLADWAILSPAEERAVLAAGARRAEFPSRETLASRFARQVALAPDAPAVTCEDTTWSYRELDRRARRLAHRLRALGVGPEARVGLVAERSLELVAGILAIVQAGGAYVPLDPASPPERLAFQVADSGAMAILVQPGLEDRVGEPQVPLVSLVTDGDDERAPLEDLLAADHLAYVIYTSGSTGQPKGSLLSQANVVRLFDATEEWFRFGPEDVWTLFHSYAFDFSVWELWGALLYGGRLVVVPYWVSRSPEAFHELLEREGVTVLNQTPSAFRQLVAADLERPAEALARLRTVVFGGEALEPTSLGPWYRRHGESATLVNMYGITETTVHVTYRPLTSADAARAGSSPVGVPIPDLEIQLLDALGRPVPIGVPGEIHVGGAGLARGYLGRPGLTAERFVPSLFGPAGARLYRSGDLARRRPPEQGGELEFLGRIDHQVKIRGFRIELGEIEAALASHPSVSQAAVLVREDGGDRRLVGFVVAVPGATISSAELKTHAAARLNDYMVPAAIVELPALPLTVNGKLDRAALSALGPAAGAEPERSPHEAPRGPIEEAVAAVWSEVLGVPEVGRHDDFFDLGGHSLLATKVLSRLKQRLGVTLPLRALFEAGTVLETARALEARQRGEEETADSTPIPRLPRGGPLALSFGQERLWFLDRLEPGSATYNVPFALRLVGALDVERLREALAAVFRRHESLRSVFAEVAGQPVQIVRAEWLPELAEVDLSGLPAAARERTATAIAAREAATGFDLERGPLARFVLLRLAPDSHAALWTAHHIVSDGWSTGVFLADLAAFYRGAELPALPIQVADHAAWQRATLDTEAQLRFWRERLSGAPTLLPLPTDRPRPPLMNYRGRAVPFRLAPELGERVRELARKSGATPFMVFLAAYSGFLGRLAGRTDLLLGSPAAGRRRIETEGLIGFFVNTLVLRADLAGEPAFTELLTRARETTLTAYAHEDVPFEKVVQELAPERSLAYPPLFQAMLSLEAGQGQRIDLGALTLAPQPQPIRVSKFDLTLAVVDAGEGGFGGHWAFSTDLFDPTTVLRHSARLATVLAAVLERPELPLAAWPVLTRAELHAVVVEWNDPRVEYGDSGALLPARFRARAAADPARVALVTDDGEVSYGELAARARGVARGLRARGVGPESIVGIAVPRSVEMVAGLLGILEAGAAYLPIDPELPEDRRRFLIEDSGAELVLGPEDLAVEPVTENGPAVDLRPEHPAYVIYTSGSTGVPKGVVVSHGALANRLLFALANDVGPDSIFLHKTTISFDVSILELFAPLLAGGRTVLAKPGGASDPEYLLRRIAEAGVTHTSFPPTLLGALLDAGRLAELPSLESVVTGGEVVPPELAGKFYEGRKDEEDCKDCKDVAGKAPGVLAVDAVLAVLPLPLLFNRYGPTETTISVTSWTCRPGTPERVLPIGRPTAKAEIHLLDRAGRPVPVGVPGELHVGGPGVARGYLRRPGKTAEVFVPDPFSGRAGARLYRTGDLTRWRTDGALEFVGRIDTQVKIRGFRVELGEIESTLARHADVREAAVVDWGEGNAKTLAAYLVPQNGRRPTDGDLRALLGAALPPYMVPSAYLWLDRLPLTPSGKIDRKALPPPGAGANGEDEPPAGATERELAAIWCEILARDAVGRHTNFFELGGHSLLATQVVSRARETFAVDLPLRALFERPTVAGLAEEVERLRRDELAQEPRERPELGPTPRAADEELPLSFAQERLWFLEQLDGGTGTYNIPVALRLTGPLDPARLERALNRVIARHEALRTTFQTGSTGAPVQRIAPALTVSIAFDSALVGLATDLEAAVEALAAAEADQPFDLATGPLLRARLLTAGPTDHVFLLTVHHIVADGWSAQVILRETGAFYGVDGDRAVLPALPIQYADFARWQRSWLTGSELDRQLGYWRGALAGAPEVLELPFDRPRPAVAGAQGRRRPLRLAGLWHERLEVLLEATGTTPFMALLAAYGAWLGRLAGTDTVVVGAPVANRNRPEIEGLVGFFVNTLALPVDATGRPGFGDLLARVRETTLGAYDHQDLPFEKLVAELAPARSRSHSPLFQVMLVLQNAAAPAEEAAPADPDTLTLRTLLPAGTTTKFDLTLALGQTPSGFSGFLGYKTELFDRTTIDRFAGSLERFLAAAVAEPGRPVAALPLLSRSEEHQLRHEWNDTARHYPLRPVTELVAAWAAATPRAVAVVDPEGRETDFAELLDRADRLAARLQSLGAGPERVVAVCFERGTDLIVAILGVLRAGAAYLPLEPAHPDERLAELLADAAPVAILASAGQARRLAGALELDDAGEPAKPIPVGLDDLAYLIYTSGSTGRPKPVGIDHRALAERLAMMAELFAFGPGDRQLQFVSVAFDMAVEEIFVTLATGATLVLAPAAAVKKPSDLLAFASDHGVTKMNLPASLWHQIADDVAAGTVTLPPTLRILVTGAEAASPDKFATLLAACPADTVAFNLYGPTETTIIAAGTRMPPREQLARRVSIPLGRPLPNAHLTVVDGAGRRVPIGVPGELLIGGAGMGRGYLGRPGLTAERFVPDAESTVFAARGYLTGARGYLPGARAYRTGDRVRHLADGTLEFLGRIDQQVKVRGFRIELGEIEEHLRRHPDLADAAVAARTDAAGGGTARLVAYLVAEPERPLPNVTALRAFLAERLPEALIPAVFVPLPALPRNSSGKVDRRALPAPDADRPDLGSEYVAPRTELERFLVELVAEVLGVERAGVLDNFFDLGGDSLKGAVLVNRLEQALGEYVYVTALFDTANLAELGEYLAKHYPRAISERFGAVVADAAEPVVARVTPERALELRAVITPLPPYEAPAGAAKNPPAVFLLSPPRSGSTLLRVLLAGHPKIFAPPEIDLLSFDTLAERRAAFSGRYAFWLEGLVRAVMAIDGCDAASAEALLAELEGKNATVREAYGWLQARIGGRLLVDKTPSYALDREVLARAEALFDGPRYVHLLRHPYGMIRSFEEARLDQTFFRHDHPFSRRELAELVWLVSQENILAHLATIEPERRIVVRFEDLVADPKPALERLSAFLGLDFDPEMLEPYKERERRMTDGIHPLAKMLGDVKFHQHQGIDAQVAERWREAYPEDFLGDVTWAMAERLGYEPPKKRRPIRPLAPEELAAGLPLSFAQERLWFLDQLLPGTSLYNLATAVRLRGSFDRAALEQALNQLVERHPALRTTFETTDEGARQRVAPVASTPLAGAAVADEGAQRSAVLAFVREPFDLAAGPLFRAALFPRAADDAVLVLAMHHIVSDGWSMGLLVRDLGALYRRAATGAGELVPAGAGYPDFAHWQRTTFAAEELGPALDWWRRELAGVPPLELPADHPRRTSRAHRGGVVPFRLDDVSAARLLELARVERATLFQALAAAIVAHLHRLTGASDLTLGTPVAGRTGRAAEEIVGFFVNTLVLRARPAAELSFRELLAATRRGARDAFLHQDVPFERVVDALKPERNLGRTALFTVMLAMQELPASPEALESDLALEPFDLPSSTAEFEATWSAFEVAGRIGGRLNYDAELFEHTTALRWAAQLERLIAGAVAAPDASLVALPLLSRAERHQIAVEWSDTAAQLPPPLTLHERVAVWAERTPEALALFHEHDDGRIEERTYRELVGTARRLARRLVRLGAGPEVRVATCLPRGIDAIVALLGVLEAGAVHVPIDPSVPAERKAFQVSDSGARVVITVAAWVEDLPEGLPTVVLDRDAASLEEEDEHGPLPRVGPRHAAYVIYTSGSTGRPKGVVVEHRSAVNYVAGESLAYGHGPGDRLLLFAPLSFDASVDEVFNPLTSGATLVLRNDAMIGSAAAFFAALERWGVTLLNPPTAFFNELAQDLAELRPPAALRLVVFGGEAALPDRLLAWRRWLGPAVRLANAYGPTETTIGATRWEAADGEGLPERVAIGRPIANLRATVRGPRGELQPVGVAGELVLAGRGVTRGYGGAPGATAERFRPEVDAPEPGARAYHSGDLARWLPGGNLEFLGRLDHQVKIRGHRVELGEIESALAAHPAVRQVAVVAREDRPGDRRLVAYVALTEPLAASAGELRRHLAERLAEPFQPKVFVFLPALPLSSSDKVDRRALPPPPESSGGREDGAFEAPEGPVEELLAKLWASLLNVDAVGRHDGFFELGGHSLLVTRVVARVRAAFGVELPVRTLFEAPTVAALARSIEALSGAEPPAGTPLTSRPWPVGKPVPASFGQARLWFLERLTPGLPTNNLPVSLALFGRLDAEAFERAILRLTARHDSLRTTFSLGTEGPLAWIAEELRVDFARIDLSALPAERREEVAQEIAQREALVGFDLELGPLVRWRLVDTGEERHRLVVVLHHAIADGWSIGILIRDLAALYREEAGGPPAELAELPLRYADFALWQRERLAGELAAREIAYWRRTLEGAPALLPLPVDRPRPAQQRFRGASLSRLLPATVAQAMAQCAAEREVTPFMLLLAALAAHLARHSGEDDVVIGSPVAGRTHAELEPLVGLFLNTLALRLRTDGDPTFGALLARARSATLDAYAHQHLPFERLVEELAVPRSLAHAPIFQVLLVFQNTPEERIEVPGLALAYAPLAGKTAKFDLTLSVAESPAGPRLTWIYNTDLFEAGTVERLARRFEALLRAVVANPELPLSSLPLLLPEEETQLRSWNATAVDYGTGGETLVSLFEAQVDRTPGAVAVVLDESEGRAGHRPAPTGESAGGIGPDSVGAGLRLALPALTYRDLDRRANQLAHRLRRLGVGPEVKVGIAAERSLELVVGLYGILKAGGAYVPIDPSYPEDRIAYMLADAGVPVLLTQAHLVDQLPEHGATVVRLDDPTLAEEPATRPERLAGPDHLAYTIYTSGSTGRPKGAMNAHRGIVNRLLWMQVEYGLDATDRVLQRTPFSFDVSVWEFFWPLLVGAQLVIAKPEGHRDPAYLIDVIERAGVTTLHFVPSMLQVFVEAPGVERCTSLRRIMASGEALPADLVQRHYQRLDAPLHNLYGPTEAAVDVTYWPTSPDDPAIPIGHPVANTRIHIVDAHGHVAPVGVAGELLIGGVQVGRGYHGRPALTAERFVPDPFSEVPGARLYRTGDLARWTLTPSPSPAGGRGEWERAGASPSPGSGVLGGAGEGDRGGEGSRLEYLGRIDFQVKIRGFRIELGEIEAALAAQPGVREAVVAVRTVGGGPALVAYLTGAELDLDALAPALAARLPEYMVPAHFVVLPELPLNPSGKVDRKRLPEPELRARSAERTAPRNALETALVALWAARLATDDVGVDDNFFALGGNSIGGALLINELQEKLGEIVHVVALFNSPTPALMAAFLEREYPGSVGRLSGAEGGFVASPTTDARIGPRDLAVVRELLDTLPDALLAPVRNRPAAFVLGPPRSGTTLLRVMLAGHPGLFAPPELELLNFNTLTDRRASFSGSSAYRLEGLIRALMELTGEDATEATAHIAAWERDDLPIQEVYQRIQDRLGDRLLVDKTPTYAWDPATLRRAEAAFEAPLYLHLVRHPYGTLHSFEEARIDQVFFLKQHPYSRRQLAELLWWIAHRNALDFLRTVPASRQLRVHFEDQVTRPEEVLRRIADFLGVAYHPAMADPYGAGTARMTDGLHAESRMIGDVKFHQHRAIDAKTSDRWHQAYDTDFLAETSWQLAEELGIRRGVPTTWRPAFAHEAIPAQPGAPTAPLSYGQERLWFLSRLEDVGSAYNIPLAAQLTGELSVSALALAFADVAARHEVLRTAFRLTDQGPLQVVHPAPSPSLPVVDLSGLPAEVRADAAARLRSRAAAESFDLERAPLTRTLLVRLGPTDHQLIHVLHHTVADGWSVGLLLRELAIAYGARCQGRPPAWAPLPIQYGDFARWQRRALAGGALERELEHWRERLAGLPALALVPDHPRPARQTFRGATLGPFFPTDDLATLRQLARDHGATAFMVLTAGLAAFLARFTGQDDFALGTPVSNRHRTETEGLVGFLLNTLALRMPLEGDPTFGELLTRVREVAVDAFAHQDVPFEQVVRAVAPGRDLSRSPLFQASVSHQAVDGASLPPFGEVHVSLLPVPTEAAKFELSVSFLEYPEHLVGQLEYNLDLYDPTTAERWAGALATLLSAAVRGPARRLSELPVLAPGEEEQIRATNATARPYPADRSIADLFATVAAARPGAPAVSDGRRSLTYGELEAAANRLAQRLTRLGVGPEDRVGLALDRSVDLVVAVLGVAKAGAAYVPVEPSHPAERIGHVLSDAGIQALVTASSGAARFAFLVPAGAPVVAMDDPSLAEEPDEAPAPGAASEHLAYVLYTSGSTGRPKGVLVNHRSFVNFLTALGRTLGVRETDTLLAVTTLAFDIAGLELLLPLLHGGRVWVAGREDAGDPARLARLLAESGATLFQATPATWTLVAESGWRPARPLRGLIGGEAVPRELAERLLARGVELWNVYGPTETTVWSAATPIVSAAGPVPFGGPVANTELHAVDRAGRPVPYGVAGELWIGGDGVARGYHGRPALTAERFVPDPFSGRSGARVYRTGDRVRRRLDGRFDFLGRLDFQVKLRGFRIELGEIEAALERHPGVGRAVVVLDGAAPGEDGRLVAYLSPGNGAPPATAELRELLAAVLPSYMVPALFVVLPALPLNASGKVDRRALPAPEGLEPTATEPRTPLEAAVLARFRSALPAGSALGVDGDFFAAGGSSLAAALLAQRLGADLATPVPVVTLFERATPASFAAWLAAEVPEAEERLARGVGPAEAALPASVVPLGRGRAGHAALWLVHPMSGEVTFYRHLVEALATAAPNLPILGFEAPGIHPDGATGQPLDTIEALAGHYVDLLAELAPAGPVHLGGSSLGGAVVWEMARRLEARGRQVGLVALLDAIHPAELDADFAEQPAAAVLLAYLTGTPVKVTTAELADLSEDEVRARILAAAPTAGVSGELVEATLYRYLDVLAANRRAYASYRPGVYGGPVLFLRAAQVEAGLRPADEPWRALAPAGLEVQDIPGSHLGMHRPPHVAELARALGAAFVEVRDPVAGGLVSPRRF